jgi:hypothetical protein
MLDAMVRARPPGRQGIVMKAIGTGFFNCFGRITPDKITADVQHLEKRGRLDPSEIQTAEYLYTRLSIIDAKMSELLTFNSVLIAAASLLLSSDINSKVHLLDSGITIRLFVVLSALLWMVSTGFCLWMSWLKWEHLSPNRSFDDYRRYIATETLKRTRGFNIALTCIALAVLFMFGSTAVSLARHHSDPPACLNRCSPAPATHR